MRVTIERVVRQGLAVACAVAALAAQGQGANPVVYRCPGPPVLYTDAMSPTEARDKNCRTIEGATVTVIQGTRPRATTSPATPSASGARPASGEGRVDPSQQRTRDNDARRILEDELKKEEDKLAELQKDYNNGNPERRGEERNFQKYQERVAELKAAVGRKESDIAAIKRELSKVAP
jgi:hypothetical protein